MQIKNSVPSAILTAATAMLQPYVPDLTPKSLVMAIKDLNAGGIPQVAPNAPEKPYTRAEVCNLLGISLPTLNRYIKCGMLRKITLSLHTVRIDPASVRNLLEKMNNGQPGEESEQGKGI